MPPQQQQLVAIIGASDRPDRYSYQAAALLSQHGYPTLLITPRVSQIEGRPTYATLRDAVQAKSSPHTITMYVGAAVSTPLSDEILAANPKRVIFNPGAENQPLADILMRNGIECVNGCTLVMLRTAQF